MTHIISPLLAYTDTLPALTRLSQHILPLEASPRPHGLYQLLLPAYTSPHPAYTGPIPAYTNVQHSQPTLEPSRIPAYTSKVSPLLTLISPLPVHILLFPAYTSPHLAYTGPIPAYTNVQHSQPTQYTEALSHPSLYCGTLTASTGVLPLAYNNPLSAYSQHQSSPSLKQPSLSLQSTPALSQP